MEDGKFRVKKFNGQNFSLWKMQMEDYLYKKDLHLPLGGKTKMPTGMKDEEWNLLDRKALGTIRLCLAVSVTFNILKETTTAGLMEALSKLYEKPSTSNKVFFTWKESTLRTKQTSLETKVFLATNKTSKSYPSLNMHLQYK